MIFYSHILNKIYQEVSYEVCNGYVNSPKHRACSCIQLNYTYLYRYVDFKAVVTYER